MILDYEAQREAFLKLAKIKNLRKSEITVYLALLGEWERQGWTKIFSISTWGIYKLTHLALSTIIYARISLAEKGFFQMQSKFPKGTYNRQSRYQLFPFYCTSMV